MPSNVVLASNTSSISITRIAAQTERPHRVVSTLMLYFLLAQGGRKCLTWHAAQREVPCCPPSQAVVHL